MLPATITTRELTLRDTKALELLPYDDNRDYVKNKITSTPIRTIEAKQMIKEVGAIISGAIKNLGHWNQVTEEGVLNHNITGVITEILTTKEIERGKSKHDFKNITLKEFRSALDNGSKGKYKRKDEIVTVSVESMIYWMNCYLKEEARVTSIKYYYALLTADSEKKEPTPEEQEKIIQGACLRTFEEFRNKRVLNPLCNSLNAIVYDYLRKKFEIKWEEVDRKVIEAQGQMSYDTWLKENKVSPKSIKLPTKEGLLIHQKKIALSHYLTKLINEDKQIEF